MVSDTEKKSTWEKVGSGIGDAFSKGGVIIVAIGGIAIVAYFIYSYLQSGLSTAMQGYQGAVQSLVDETDQFLKENEAKGIHGLTADQQAVIQNVKQPQVDFWEQQVQQELAARNYMSNGIADVLYGLAAAAVILALGKGISYGVQAALKSKAAQVKQDMIDLQAQQSGTALDSWSQVDFAMQMTAWSHALSGDTGAASGLQDSLSQMYTSMMLPSLQIQSQVLTTELTTLTAGTTMYIAVMNMLTAVNAAITYQVIPTLVTPEFMPLPLPI
jgi:hypothetical protein